MTTIASVPQTHHLTLSVFEFAIPVLESLVYSIMDSEKGFGGMDEIIQRVCLKREEN